MNCIRTFPALRRIYTRYKPYGFEIIGVHAPEFDFAYKPENVRFGTKRQRIPWPVVVDSDFSIWRAYDSNSWPNKFLIGSNGIISPQHRGEGASRGLGRQIRAGDQKGHPQAAVPAAWALPPREDDFR